MRKIMFKMIFSTALIFLFLLNVTSTFDVSFGGEEVQADPVFVDCHDYPLSYTPGAMIRFCPDCSIKTDWFSFDALEQCDILLPYVPVPFCPPTGSVC